MSSECVVAMVWIRPLNKKESNEKSEICVRVLNTVSLQMFDSTNPEEDRQFTFD